MLDRPGYYEPPVRQRELQNERVSLGRSFQHRGPFTDDATYAAGDIAMISGSAFIALRDNPGSCPGPVGDFSQQSESAVPKGLAAREVEHVDAGESPIRRLADQSLERRRAVGVSRLAQDGEQGMGFAHGRTLRSWSSATPKHGVEDMAVQAGVRLDRFGSTPQAGRAYPICQQCCQCLRPGRRLELV